MLVFVIVSMNTPLFRAMLIPISRIFRQYRTVIYKSPHKMSEFYMRTTPPSVKDAKVNIILLDIRISVDECVGPSFSHSIYSQWSKSPDPSGRASRYLWDRVGYHSRRYSNERAEVRLVSAVKSKRQNPDYHRQQPFSTVRGDGNVG